MNQLQIRILDFADIGYADGLRAAVGWNQTPRDWERFLRCEPQGCFLAEQAGKPAGTATTICYGTQLGWIGMLLVHPDCRGQGIGSALLRRCLDYLDSQAVTTVKLDATPLGQPLYERLGFKPEWPLTRWERAGERPDLERSIPAPPPWSGADLEQVIALDSKAFGVPRPNLFREFARQRVSLALEGGSGPPLRGFAILRPGARACYLGPLADGSGAVASDLIDRCVAAIPGRAIFWDIPDANETAAQLARARGFTPQRHLLRMVRGENACAGKTELQFGIAGPEVG